MSVTLVQTVTGATLGASSLNVTPASTGPGSLLTVGITTPALAGAVYSITDNQGNTYTLRQNVTNTSVQTYWYDCLNATGGVTSVTANYSGSISSALIFQERSGVTGGFDVGTTNQGLGSVGSAGPTSTTTYANELVICYGGISLPPFAYPGTGYGNLHEVGGSSYSFTVEDKQVTSIGTQSGSMSVGSPVSLHWTCGIVTYNTTATSSVTVNVDLLGSTSAILDATPSTPGTYYTETLESTTTILNATAQVGATKSVNLLGSGSGIFSANAQVGVTINVELLGSTSDVFKFASGQGAVYVSVASLTSTSESYSASVMGNVFVSVPCLESTSEILPASFESAPNVVVNVDLLGSTSAIFPATTNIGPTIQARLLASGSGVFPASVETGVTLPVTLLGSESGTLDASAGTGRTVSVDLLASTTVILHSTAESGVIVNVKLLGSTTETFDASTKVGITISTELLGSGSGVLDASVSRGIALSLELLDSTSGTLAATHQVGVTVSPEILESPAQIYDASLSIPASVSLELLSSSTAILLPSAFGGSVYLQVQCLGSQSDVFPAAFSSVTQWYLSIRQQIQYLGFAQVYRETANELGDAVWFLVISDMPCYLYTTPNMDKPSDTVQVKESNVFTDDRLAFPVQADIRAEDKIYYQGPTPFQNPSPDTGSWFTVMGQARNRPNSGLRMANKGEVYLNPTNQPALQGVA
jgi:hypothetical protein